MTFKDKYWESDSWHEKVIIVEIYHFTGKHRHNDWTISKTAAYFGISVGLVSENLKLADALHQNPKLIECSNRQAALEKIR